MLVRIPNGVSWGIIPWPKATSAEQQAAQMDVCWKATSIVDTYCRQVLRATADTEQLAGPGVPRCNVDRNTGNGVLQMKRWPVTSVLAILTAPARSFDPVAWSPVPAGNWRIRHPLIYSGDSASATAPDGGWTIDVAPDYINWRCGRGGQVVQVSYVNGWPHTSLTETAGSGASVLSVDDVTGWAGASGFAYDGAATEQLAGVSVSAASPLVLPNGAGEAQAGPGTITLTAPLAYEHQQGTVISALPASVIHAAALAATVQALEGAVDAIAIQSLSGEHVQTGMSSEGLSTEYELLLDPYRRVA